MNGVPAYLRSSDVLLYPTIQLRIVKNMAEEPAQQARNDIQNAHIYNADVEEPSRNKLLMDAIGKYRAIYDKSYPGYKN